MTKISSACLQIGTVFPPSSISNSETTQSTVSETPQRLPEKTTEKLLKSVERITNIAAENIKKSVLRHLQFNDNDQVENVPNEITKRTYHYNLTDVEVREEVFQITEAKRRKLEEAQLKKIEIKIRKKN
jgi:hypothetical protein